MNIQAISKFIFFCTLILLFAKASIAEDIASLTMENNILTLNVELADGSKTYGKYSGPQSLPTKIEAENISNLANYTIAWPWPIFEKNKNGTNAIYQESLQIPIEIIPLDKSQDTKFYLKISYLICNKDGCFPKEKTFLWNSHPPYKIHPPLQKWGSIHQYTKNNELIIELEASEDKTAEFILKSENNNIFLPQSLKKNGSKYIISYDITTLKNGDKFLLESSLLYEPPEINMLTVDTVYQNSSLSIYILMAILGGFILNFMPCVLPVLSLKLFTFLNTKSEFERKVESTISFFTIILYFSFLALCTIISKKSGQIFIPGFTFQEPRVIIWSIIVITIMLSVLREQISFNIPHYFTSYNSTNKYISTSISTLISSILATPCTAPFLVTSMTFAMTQSDSVIFVIMLSAGFGFASPYFITFFVPSFLNFLPKSGKWQNHLKSFFSLMLVATIIWLVWLINAHLGIYAAFLMMFLVYILRFCLEYKFKSKIKFLCFFTLIIFCNTLPFSVSTNFQKLENYYKSNWQNFNKNDISALIDLNQIALVTVTADWCVTCQLNKFWVLESISTTRLMKKHSVHGFIADITKENKEGSLFLQKNGASGIPFTIIYGPKNKKGIVLPVLLGYKELEEAILSVGY